MDGVNRVTLLGNLGTDPEIQCTKKETTLCRFRLATSERRKNTAGELVEHTEWHNIVVFGKTAENCVSFLRKGRQIYVEGRLRTRAWQDADGQTRNATEIVAGIIQFIGSKGKAKAEPEVDASEKPESVVEPYIAEVDDRYDEHDTTL
jgi:single-strand DNA-binding protein